MEIYCYSLWGNDIFPTMQTFPTMPITNVRLSTQCTVYKRTHTDRHIQIPTDRQTDRQTIIHDYSTARWAGLTILNVPSGTHCHQQNVRSLSMRMTVCLNKLQSPWATSGENCMIIPVISFVWQTNGRTNTPPIAKLCSTIAERDNSKYW